MNRDPLFRIGDFAIWSAILGGVIGYQVWTHASEPALTTVVSAIGQMAG
ncbi:hypothetical protein [Pararhizobium sp. PWRC1-1]